MNAYFEKALNEERARVREAMEGGRNHACNKAAYNLGRLMMSGGFDPDEIADVLLEDAYVAYATSAEDAKPGLRIELRRTIESGLRAGQKNPRIVEPDYANHEEGQADVEEEVAEHRDLFLAQPRKGHRGGRMTVTMVAIHDMAIEQGTTRQIRAPYRKILVYSGLGSNATIKNALDDLVADGYLERVRRHDASRAATYRLAFPTDTQACRTPPPQPGVQECDTYAHNGHDAFQTKALGRTGQRILGFLEAHPDEWFTQAEVARTLGPVVATINRHVLPDRPLVSHGLIKRDDRGRIRLGTAPTMVALDTVAFDKRTAGTKDRRRRAAVRAYQQRGYLTDDLHWIDQATGEPRRSRADWLAPKTTTTVHTVTTSTPEFDVPESDVPDTAVEDVA